MYFDAYGVFLFNNREEKDKQNGIRTSRFGRNKTDDS